MPRMLPDELLRAHPQMLRAGIEQSEIDRKNLAEVRADIGNSIARTFELMNITKQEASHRMGYRDQSAVTRWCTAKERPLFDKLFALEGFEETWLLVRAKAHPRMDVVTEIRLRRGIV